MTGRSKNSEQSKRKEKALTTIEKSRQNIQKRVCKNKSN